MSGPRLGVMTFSLCGDLWRRRMTVDESLAAVASLGGSQELELIGSLALQGFPSPDDDEVRRLRVTIERLGLVPSVYCADLDRGRSRRCGRILRRSKKLEKSANKPFIRIVIPARPKLQTINKEKHK